MAYFPLEWDDDNRMNFMFSAFPENREVNPKHWDSKLQFWRSVISNNYESHDEMIIDVSVLKTRFQRNGVAPLGLGVVLKEMVNSGEIMSSEEFLASVYDTWGSWSYGLAKKTFWWSVGKVWQENTELNCGSFILIALVKKKAELVLSCHQKTVEHSITDNIVPEKVLKARLQLSNIKLNDQELDIVICQLRKDGDVTIHVSENGEKVLKFADKNKRKVSVVSETDLNILRLRKAEASIQLQINKLQKDIKELQDIVVMSVKQGLRNKAKKILTRKHMLSKTLDKKESLLLNTQDILHRIQDAHSDANVVEALKAGTQVFKSFSQESGLTLDNVEKIMMDVEETMDDAAEIDRTISEGSKSVANISGFPDDSEDLEKELAELMFDDEKDHVVPKTQNDAVRKDLLDQLPEVPNTIPAQPKQTKTLLLQ